MKVYATVLASGTGSRMKSEIPKQYMSISNKPVIEYSLDKFISNKYIEKVMVVVSEDYLEYAKDLLSEYIKNNSIHILIGGATRTDSVNNAIKYIECNFEVNDDDVIICHDSARPLLSNEIINNCIESSKNNFCTTVAKKSVDTLFMTNENKVDKVLDREKVYMVQTPQIFNICEYHKNYNKLSDEEILKLTDSTSVFLMNNKDVSIVEGNSSLLKITVKEDLLLIESMMKNINL